MNFFPVLQTAPVNRNFQETRERLRLILTKKKAKSNSAAANNDKQVSGQNSSLAQISAAVSQPGSYWLKLFIFICVYAAEK